MSKTPKTFLAVLMRIPSKESLGLLSRSLYTVAIKRRNASCRIHSFLATSHPLVFRTPEAYYSKLSLSSLPMEKGNRLVESSLCGVGQQNKYWKNGFFLEQEVEENAGQIRRVISNINNGTVEDVVQALKSDESCSKIQLTSQLVDALLHKFGYDWKSALGFFQWANFQSDYKHATYSCDKMVDLLGKSRQMNRMWDFVNEMHSRGLVTLETVAKIMRRLAGAGKWKDVIKVFDDLEALGLDKNTESMNLMLDTLCKEKKVDVAHEVYLELRADIPPDDFTFNILVNGWCNARMIDEAMWTIQEMKDCGFRPSVITYSTVIKAH
nr:pentatricopeptide repeat protein AaPPR967 [Agave angustifolia]